VTFYALSVTSNGRPGRSFNGLAEPARADAEFASQVNKSLSGGTAFPAFKNDGDGELRSVPARVAVPAPILMILGHGSPAEICDRVDVPSCRAVAAFFSRLSRPVKCGEYESVHSACVWRSVLAQCDRKVLTCTFSNLLKHERFLAPARSSVRQVPAANAPEVRHLIPVLEIWRRQPTLGSLRGLSGRRIKGLLDKQANSPVLLRADSVQGHCQTSRSINPLAENPARDSALTTAASYRTVQAAHLVPVADLIKPFPFGDGQPAFSSIGHGRGSNLHQGPGSGVCSTVRAVCLPPVYPRGGA